MEESPKDYFKLQKRFFKTVGMSLEDDSKITYSYKIYHFSTALIMTINYGILEVCEAFYNKENADAFVEVISYLATDLIGLVKLYVLVFRRKEIIEILANFETKETGDYKKELVKKYVKITNFQAYVYQICCGLVLLFGICGSLAERIRNPDDTSKWKMPFVSFSLFPIDKSPNYEIAWFYQGFTRVFYCGIVSTTDALLGAILAHVSVQCMILQNRIEKIRTNSNSELKNAVKFHWEILKQAAKFEEVFGKLMLCEFFGTLFILCLCLYHASLYDLFSRAAAQDFVYTIAISVQVFLCCYWGNEVTVQSQKIADSCAKTEFVGKDLTFQKNLVFVIRKAQKPIVLTAGKFADLSLRTYVWILRASYSYYMVLRSYGK